ncbi:sulfurtransferase [Nocardioides sp. GY 10127]|uniref:sulfurtransferase n=1 Tax=Nocardioides sp. GY 10127 TaxID=2569762 RepID=UPI0010A8BABE|nr:sulfurtransferase [Nocardioides sp. GY 10127]TIC86641.1 sulfurtransferase [Nocardioides sp. GY 10127]
MPFGPLVTAQALRTLLEEGTPVTVLDVRYRLGGPGGPDEHEQGHVPGAAYLDLDTALAAPPHSGPGGSGGRHPLPDQGVLQEALRAAGVRAGVPVVAYDDWSGHAAARCWWLLRHHGVDDVAVLDGGWSAWREEGGAVELGPTSVLAGDVELTPGRLPTVDASTAQEADVLLDARAAERYRGEVEPVDPVAGHVPGALNAPTSGNLGEDGRFLDAERLAARYAALGAVPGADVAVYCGSGVTAAHDVLALAVAGVNAALYPGSWSDWVSDPRRPVERG